MRSLRVLTLVFVWSFVACGLFGGEPVTSPGAPVVWPQEVLQCGSEIPDVIATVSSVLQRAGEDGTTLSEAAVAELEQLARDHGPSIIVCLVDLLRLEWTRVGLSAAPDRAAAAQRAAHFLKSNNIAIAGNAAYKP